MQIVNTYFDADRDLWWKIFDTAFFKVDEIHQASSHASGQFDVWRKTMFTKVEIGTTYD